MTKNRKLKERQPKERIIRSGVVTRTTVIEIEKLQKLENPVLIEGLPGIGFVGKLAVEYIVESLKAKKVAEIYSHHFPPQVLMEKNGTLKMLKNEIYFYKDPKKKRDLLFLAGDVQPTSPEAQYEMINCILEYMEQNGIKNVITLGGYSTGKITEKPKVFAAVSDARELGKYKSLDVLFGQAEGSIIGAAGLLIGLGKMRGIDGVCFMGETHGSYVDHRAAQKIVEILNKLLGLKVDTGKLMEKAKESEKIIRKIEEETKKAKMEMQPSEPTRPSELTYIR
ncbi:MAG: proteasome assembly chaperone family protein [Candidatus Micrarchaeia archaeon]